MVKGRIEQKIAIERIFILIKILVKNYTFDIEKKFILVYGIITAYYNNKGLDTMQNPDQYRPCVGIVLVNSCGQIFMGDRIDVENDSWQMPQGGIDEGETPEQAGWRELAEETGVTADNARLVHITPDWFFYDLPPASAKKFFNNQYIGQKQRWAVFEFLGDDGDICLTTHTQEFSRWKWEPLHNAPDLIVPFKRSLYEQVVGAVSPYVQPFKK